MVRATDGVGYCSLIRPEDQETNSVAFIFETAEVWAIDTWLLGQHSSEIFIGELEEHWPARLKGYAALLNRLGLKAPYRWIAGATGLNNRRLQYPTPGGQMRFVGWQGPQCLVDQIVTEGTYEAEQSPKNALMTFFEAIYHKCGMRRPEYLPK